MRSRKLSLPRRRALRSAATRRNIGKKESALISDCGKLNAYG